MPASDETNKAINRNEALVTEILKIVDNLPSIVPLKGDIQEKLNSLRSAMQGLRSPRIMVIGRSRAGKSSLINAICGLRVAEVSDTKPETGKAEWKDYHHDGVDLLHILDTRGLQEAEAPRKADPAKSPFESIMQAVNKECPDVVLFICKATEVHSGSQEDIDICTLILTEIKNKYKRDLPMIGVLTHCDQVAPPYERLPTDDEEKNHNIDAQVKSFYGYLQQREKLRFHIKEVVPTVAYAKYENGRNGLILSGKDYRWNITKLVETMIKYTPRETRSSLARMAHLAEFQLTAANTVVVACSGLSGVVSANPIPGAAIPVVAAIQTFMVMYIGWLSGREFSEQTVKDFAVTFGVAAGADAGMVGIADIALKFVPGWGSVLSAGASTIATKGLGDAAIAYFLNNGKAHS
ncbi:MULTISPECIES: GTPase [unclassified Microcoleus]|uniref:GTPase family protein n=1 Tax=unclassified Microcoleus TaxID=2642155 RepID=UPI002FD639F3